MRYKVHRGNEYVDVRPVNDCTTPMQKGEPRRELIYLDFKDSIQRVSRDFIKVHDDGTTCHGKDDHARKQEQVPILQQTLVP